MFRKSSIKIGLALLALLVLFMLYTITRRIPAKNLVQQKILKFPTLALFRMDSTFFQRIDSTASLIIYFDTQCSHCQYQLTELRKNIAEFSQIQVLLMSSENIARIKETAVAFELMGFPNVEFLKVNPDDASQDFGVMSVPHIFLYGRDGRLIKEFKGETKIEAILKHFPE